MSKKHRTRQLVKELVRTRRSLDFYREALEHFAMAHAKSAAFRIRQHITQEPPREDKAQD